MPSSFASSQVTASLRQASRVASSRVSHTAAPATSKRASRARQPSLCPPRDVLGAGRSSSRPPDGDAEAGVANRLCTGALVSSFMQDLRAAGRHAHKNSLPTVRQAVGMLASRHTAVKVFCAALPAAARRTRCALGPCMARSFCSWRMRSSRPGGQPETKIVPTTCFSEKTPSSPAGMDAPAAAPAAEKKHFPLLTPPFAMLITNPY